MRESRSGLGGIEELLREYSLSTKEGLALMVLAEALLRVPDSATADRLIEDKLGQGDFAHHEAHSDVFAVNVSAWALGVAARIVDTGENPDNVLAQVTKRIGAPAVRLATRKAMHVLGNHFVLGQIDRRGDRTCALPTTAIAIRSTCWAKARAPLRMPRAITMLMRMRSRKSARRSSITTCAIAPASRSNSRPCIRVTTRSAATA